MTIALPTPVFCLAGDSILRGAGGDNMLSPGWYIAERLGASYVNAAVSGRTTADVATNIAADVTNRKPRFAVINGGVNNISGSVGDVNTFTANWTTTLNSVTGAGIIPIVCLIGPWTGGTNGQMQTSDTYNTALTNLLASYPTAISVNPRTLLGVERGGGDPGNLWDINAAYLFQDDGQNIHLNELGARKFAQAVLTAINVAMSNGTSEASAPARQWFTSRIILGTHTDDGATVLQVGKSAGQVSAIFDGAVTLTTYGEMPVNGSPPGGATGKVRFYCDTSGGKTRIMAVFPTGVAQQVAIEP